MTLLFRIGAAGTFPVAVHISEEKQLPVVILTPELASLIGENRSSDQT